MYNSGNGQGHIHPIKRFATLERESVVNQYRILNRFVPITLSLRLLFSNHYCVAHMIHPPRDYSKHLHNLFTLSLKTKVFNFSALSFRIPTVYLISECRQFSFVWTWNKCGLKWSEINDRKQVRKLYSIETEFLILVRIKVDIYMVHILYFMSNKQKMRKAKAFTVFVA